MREATVQIERDRHAMFEALTDLYAILPLGYDAARKRAVPLLRKPGREQPGLTGAALEAAVDRFVARVPHKLGRMN